MALTLKTEVNMTDEEIKNILPSHFIILTLGFGPGRCPTIRTKHGTLQILHFFFLLGEAKSILEF